MKPKINIVFIIIALLAITLSFLADKNYWTSQKQKQPYGVFLGMNGDDLDKVKEYELLVIEAGEFTPEQIEKLHQAGKKVYAYLNVGAIEQYRPYYQGYQSIVLSDYEDWPDEKWVDVSREKWQSFIIAQGTNYINMGADGIFVDNTDVYYHYPKEDVYRGLVYILKQLHSKGIQILNNGGDAFVLRTIEENIAKDLFDGVNQESVFTCINFKNNSYSQQNPEDHQYYLSYLKKVKEYGLSVYLLEYHADKKLAKQIDDYCQDNHFQWYNAKNKDLK